MGKAARNRNRDNQPPDHLARVTAGLCLHCGRRPPREGFVWCLPCTSQAHGIRRSRTEPMPTPSPDQWQALYDVLDPDQP